MKFKKLNKIVSYSESPCLIKKHHKLMALTIDKNTLNKKTKYGIAREVTKRKGKVNIQGFIDKSKLIIVKSEDLFKWEKEKDLQIKGIEKQIKKLTKPDLEFLGLEDPDICHKKRKIHLFFTIAFKKKKEQAFEVFLGHAKGKDLNNLKATKPFLAPHLKKIKTIEGYKEISIFPSKKYALVEKGHGTTGTKIALAKIKSFSKKLKEIKVLLDPAELNYSWCNGELSTGPIIDKKIFQYKDHLVGFINARSKSKKTKNKTIYSKYKIGLILINKKTHEIPWISPKPLFEDPKAKSVTFASDFLNLDKSTGILYAHVDDSFVSAYKINLKELKKILPKNV